MCIDFAHSGSIIKRDAALSNPVVVIVRNAAGFERITTMDVVKFQVCGSELKVWTEQACQSKVLLSCLQSTALFLSCSFSLIACLSSLIARIFRVRRDELVEYALDMAHNAKSNFWKYIYIYIYFQRNQVQSSVRGPGRGPRDAR